jgi:molybdenum cofactor cytidylyltransferase
MKRATAPLRRGKELTNMTVKIAAIVLAAGRSTRFSPMNNDGAQTKLAVSLAGKPLVRHAAEAALASSARPVIVVTGHARADVEGALAGLPVLFTHNERFATGLASSLQIGLAAAPAEAEGVVVLLGDMPAVTPDLVDRLVAGFASQPDALAAAPVQQGRRGNPILLARGIFAAIASLEGDVGARRLLDALPRDRMLEVPVDGFAADLDIDTREALEAATRVLKF